MKAMERASKPAYEALVQKDPKTWCKAFFETHSCTDNVENNMSESFNAWIINERFLPLLDMLQEIHYKLMVRIRENRGSMEGSEFQICPRIKKKLDIAVTQSREWRASWDGMRTFVVKNGSSTLTVDLVDRKCDCRVFDLTGIPCAHAVAAIHSRREDPQAYVSRYYTREMYLASYNQPLAALKGEEFWESHSTEELLPPYIPKKLRGRPKKQRRREEWEGGNRSRSSQPKIQRAPSGKKQHCSLCRQPGHRCTRCPLKNAPNVKEGAPNNAPIVEESASKNASNVEENGTTAEVIKELPGKTSKNQPVKRPKLPVRRKEKGILIKEPEVCSQHKHQETQYGKGKEKVVVQPKVKTRRPYLNLQNSKLSQGSVQASQQSQV
ncbi:hypothetical protein DCAR_0934972 [Daucus carota subsp. sativus]|uniref:SWIM-type domain-containing protein n=1 Tax=Daucus carota subsp. sativus TaxID=79200 RepID=A0AAF0XY59_DAUCS|nr:hypothetical protein DCAR_0934972 [Daucus carota subsp. sativus]